MSLFGALQMYRALQFLPHINDYSLSGPHSGHARDVCTLTCCINPHDKLWQCRSRLPPAKVPDWWGCRLPRKHPPGSYRRHIRGGQAALVYGAKARDIATSMNARYLAQLTEYNPYELEQHLSLTTKLSHVTSASSSLRSCHNVLAG
jgi:hypothetical protein